MYYKEKLKKHIVLGIAGFVAGTLFALFRSPDFGWGACLIGFFFAGVPYGWQLSKRVVSGIVVGHVGVMLIAFAIRVIIAIMIGWVAYPIALVYYIVKAKHENQTTPN